MAPSPPKTRPSVWSRSVPRQIKFGLVEGSFSSGVETLDLDLGKSITLISQPDGFRFTIELVAFPAETITEETITE